MTRYRWFFPFRYWKPWIKNEPFAQAYGDHRFYCEELWSPTLLPFLWWTDDSLH